MLVVPNRLIEQMNAHVEKAYPEEGAGFLIGEDGEVRDIVALSNSREDGARHNRFLFTPEDYLHAELKAESLGLNSDRRFPLPPRLPQRTFRIRPRVGTTVFLLHHHACGSRKSREQSLMEIIGRSFQV